MIKLYGYHKCSTCRKAVGLLKKKKLTYQAVDIAERAPEAKEFLMIDNKPAAVGFNENEWAKLL